MIVRWPGVVEPGRVTDKPAQLIYLMPTLFMVAQTTYPDSYQDHSILPMEGKSLMPQLSGEGYTPSQPMFWKFVGSRAVRKDQWKLVDEQGDFYTPERSKMDTLTEHKWETCTSIDPHSWGYSQATEEIEYKSSNEIIDMLVDIVSKNGNLLLNLGGTIPQLMKD